MEPPAAITRDPTPVHQPGERHWVRSGEPLYPDDDFSMWYEMDCDGKEVYATDRDLEIEIEEDDVCDICMQEDHSQEEEQVTLGSKIAGGPEVEFVVNHAHVSEAKGCIESPKSWYVNSL